jgi:hypothetical protein
MKNIIFLSLMMLQLLSACTKKAAQNAIPSCISKDIAEIQKNKNAKEPIVNQYTFQEKTVYLIDDGMGYVDSQSKVVDSNCNELGYLGGMMGKTKINGEDFFTAAVYVKTIWKQ